MSAVPRATPVAPGARAASAADAPKRPPSFGFLKGALIGALVVVPLVAVAVWVAARLGIGNRAVTMVQVIRMAALFAGTAGVLTAGGIGRLAAHASTLPGGRRTAIWRASRAQAVASAGLAIIAAIPHGQLPEHPAKWLWIALAGAVSGAVSGALIGVVCGAPIRPRAPTVKDLIRAITTTASESKTSIPAQVSDTSVVQPVPQVSDTSAKPAAKPKQRRRKKAPITDPKPRAQTPAPEPGSRAALVTPAPVPAGKRTEPVAIDTSVATEPSSPTTDGGATPLPKPVPLGEDVTGVEDPPAVALPLPAEPEPVPLPPPAPEPEPVKPAVERVEHTDVPTDVRTDVHTDVPTRVTGPEDPTEPRGR